MQTIYLAPLFLDENGECNCINDCSWDDKTFTRAFSNYADAIQYANSICKALGYDFDETSGYAELTFNDGEVRDA